MIVSSASTPPVEDPISTILLFQVNCREAPAVGPVGAAPTQVGGRCCDHQPWKIGEGIAGFAAARFAHAFDRAARQRLDRRSTAFLGFGRHHDHRHRPDPHQLAQEIQPGLTGHFDIQRQHIGRQRRNRDLGFGRVRGFAHDIKTRIAAQAHADQPSHGGGIVDDEHANRVH